MAEGAPAAPPLPPLPQTRSKQSDSITQTSTSSPPAVTNDFSFQPGTYIVQVPKEQILWIPPSENTYIVEQHRRKMQDGRRRCPALTRLISVLVVLIVILGLAIGIFFLVVRPKIPFFVVESLSGKKLEGKARKEYSLNLRSHNPSLKMGFCYEAGGSIGIFDEGEAVARGRTTGFCQAPASSSLFKLRAEGSDSNFSKKKASQILLLIQFPVRLKVWRMQVSTMRMEIGCDIKAVGLASMNETRIASQDCRARIHWVRR